MGRGRKIRARVRGPIPVGSMIMRIDGYERVVNKAYDLEATDYKRILSGEKGIVIMLDLSEMQGTEDWYGYTISPDEARKLAASLNAMADEMEGKTE